MSDLVLIKVLTSRMFCRSKSIRSLSSVRLSGIPISACLTQIVLVDLISLHHDAPHQNPNLINSAFFSHTIQSSSPRITSSTNYASLLFFINTLPLTISIDTSHIPNGVVLVHRCEFASKEYSNAADMEGIMLLPDQHGDARAIDPTRDELASPNI